MIGVKSLTDNRLSHLKKISFLKNKNILMLKSIYVYIYIKNIRKRKNKMKIRVYM